MARKRIARESAGGRIDNFHVPGRASDTQNPSGGARTLARIDDERRTMNLVRSRADLMSDFLASAGWGAPEHRPLPGDASTRRYIRLHLGDRTAMLMDQPHNA